MLTILEHLTLAETRACKNRTSLHMAIVRARFNSTTLDLLRAISDASITNITLLDIIRDAIFQLGREPGPTQP